MFSFIAKHRLIAIAIAVMVVIVLAALGISQASSPASQTAPRGYTYKPTVTTLSPKVPHPATPKPALRPPRIYSTGVCKTAMDTLRTLFVKYPSGLSLNGAGSAALTKDLKVLNSSCSPTQAAAFRTQELTPWLDYAIPK